MIDNFELIKSFLEFPNDDIYYHLQIIRRGKDHPELPAANKLIKPYFISDINDLDFYEQEIKDLCKFFKARAYINLAPKSIKKTTILHLKYLTQRIYEGDYTKIWRLWNSCAGEIKGEKPRWVVDIDHNTNNPNLEPAWGAIADFIDYKCEPKIDPINVGFDTKIIADIPTKNGIHLITTPFNLLQFREQYPDIEVHRNNPTLLYCL